MAAENYSETERQQRKLRNSFQLHTRLPWEEGKEDDNTR
jgi:hypothetical protein